MRHALILLAAIVLFASPAAAQSTSAPATKGPSPGGQTTIEKSSSMSKSTAESAQKVRRSLESSGFGDVTLVDAAHLVHARTSDGNFVVMIIDPPAGGGATTGSDTPSQDGARQALKQDLQRAGFMNIAIVDAAYLVTARTSSGATLRMMINPASATSGPGAAPAPNSSADPGPRDRRE